MDVLLDGTEAESMEMDCDRKLQPREYEVQHRGFKVKSVPR